MGNRRSKNCKAKRAKKPKALKSKHQAWDKKSDESASKSGSAFERFFFSLLCFQWFCNKRRSDALEDEEDDIALSRMAWHQSRRSSSQQEVDPMMERVPGPRVGGDRIPTRRGGARPSSVLPYNQPVSYEGAAAADASSPAPTLSSDAQSNLIQALEAMDKGAHQSTKSPEEFGRVFSPLPGSVMEADHPASNLLVAGAQAAGFPVRDQSTSRYGQLPPLRHTVGAPNPPSSNLTDASQSISVSGVGQSTEQDSDDDFGFDEVINVPSDDIGSDKQQTKKILATKKGGEESEDIPGSNIPSLEEFVKQEEQKKKEEEKREKKEHKKDRKQQKKEKKREKKMEKKIAKMDRKKLMQQQKEEIKAEKAEKKAAKSERAAAEGETKKRSRLATRLHEMIKDSDTLAGDKMEMEQRKLEKKQRRREAKARRKMREIARLELDIKILWQRLERKDKKITQLCTRRDRLSYRAHDFSITDFKLDFRIGEYKRRFNNIKNAVDQLKKIIDRKRMKVEKLAPQLFAEAAKKPQNLACDDLSIESISTIDFDDDCSIASFDSDSESDAAEIIDIIDLEDCSDSDSESDSDEEPDNDIDDDDDDDFCAYDENETEDEQIAKLFMNFCYHSTHDTEEEAGLEAPMAREKASKPAARESDRSSNVQEVLRKAQERLQKMDESRAAEKEKRTASGIEGRLSSKNKPSCSSFGNGKEPATGKPAVRKAFY